MATKKGYRSCPQHPLEFKDAELQKWWLNLFDELEKIHFKERHKIGSVVAEVVTERTYDILKPILNLERNTRPDVDNGLDIPTPSDFRSLDRESDIVEDVPDDQEHAEEWAEDEEWEYEDEEYSEDEEEQQEEEILPEEDIVSHKTTSGSDVPSLFVEAAGMGFTRDEELTDPYTNPYLSFLRLPAKKAAIWRPLVDPIPTPMHDPDPVLSLEEKAALVTYLISKEFYDWFKSIGGTEVHTFSDRVLAELFCVGFDQLAAHSLCSRMKEMPSVPTDLARETGYLRADYRMALKREIERDSKAEKIPRRVYAFNNTIKYPDRWVPPHNNADKWLKCYQVRPEIASFSLVWQGITHLSSTKAFVHYLRDRPHLPRPQYLTEQHMFEATKRKSDAHTTKDNQRKLMRPGESDSDTNLDDKSSSSSSVAEYESNLNLANYGIV